MSIYVPWSKVAILGMVIPPFNRNPYNGYINPYYWVDDHPLLYGNNGSLAYMSHRQNLVHGEGTSLSEMGPYRFCGGSTLDKPSWADCFRVGPYRSRNDGNPPTTLSKPLWSYLVLSDTHMNTYTLYMPGKDCKWKLKIMKWLSYRYTIQFPLFKAYLSGCRTPPAQIYWEHKVPKKWNCRMMFFLSC